MKIGDTFLVPDAFGKHLNVVLAELKDGSIVHCHLTSLDRHSDTTCIVEIGEHPFITGQTVVRYDQIQVCGDTALSALERMIERRYEPVSPNLLEKLQHAAIKSTRTADRIKNILREVLAEHETAKKKPT